MARRPVILLALMVLLPVGVLSLVGARLLEDEHRLLRQAFSNLLLDELDGVDRGWSELLQERTRRWLGNAGLLGWRAPEDLRQLVRSSPEVRSLLVLDPQGKRLFPPTRDPISRQEGEALRRLDVVLAEPPGPVIREGAAAPELEPEPASAGNEHGWRVWYFGDDLNLLFWQRISKGIFGVEIDRYQMLAEFIARLPASQPGPTGARMFELLDARGEVLHHWGAEQTQQGFTPVVERSLSAPLSAWRIRALASPDAWEVLAGDRAWLGLGAGLLALALALAGLAGIFIREHRRSLHEALQKVSFVNQVSHELKTPLTNIRLYAELLQEELPEDDPQARGHLQVVLTESERLTRLINDVLTFGRQQRGALRVRPARQVVDEVLVRVAQVHRPLLAAQGLELELDLAARREVELDADALQQILENLLANAIKYAGGGRVQLSSRQSGDRTTVRVRDHGPGIPPREQKRIFEPFVRLDSGLGQPASGTGIGLTIARALARAHGGDLVVRAGDGGGACFEVSLQTPPTQSKPGGAP